MLPAADCKFEAPWASRALRGSTDNGGFIVGYDFAEMNLAHIRSVLSRIYRTRQNQRKLRSCAGALFCEQGPLLKTTGGAGRIDRGPSAVSKEHVHLLMLVPPARRPEACGQGGWLEGSAPSCQPSRAPGVPVRHAHVIARYHVMAETRSSNRRHVERRTARANRPLPGFPRVRTGLCPSGRGQTR